MFTYVVYNTLCLKHLLTRMLRYIKQILGHDQDNKTLQILLNKLQNTFPNVAAGNKMSPPHPTPDAPSSRVTLFHAEYWTSTWLPNRLWCHKSYLLKSDFQGGNVHSYRPVNARTHLKLREGDFKWKVAQTSGSGSATLESEQMFECYGLLLFTFMKCWFIKE